MQKTINYQKTHDTYLVYDKKAVRQLDLQELRKSGRIFIRMPVSHLVLNMQAGDTESRESCYFTGRVLLCRNKDLQKWTGRFSEIRLQAGRKIRWIG